MLTVYLSPGVLHGAGWMIFSGASTQRAGASLLAKTFALFNRQGGQVWYESCEVRWCWTASLYIFVYFIVPARSWSEATRAIRRALLDLSQCPFA